MTLHKQIAIRRHAKCALVDGERLNPAAHLALAAHSQISVLSGTFPMKLPTWAGLTAVLLAIASAHSAIAAERDVFDHDNLVAWCIVPFDSAQRGPEERARCSQSWGFGNWRTIGAKSIFLSGMKKSRPCNDTGCASWPGGWRRPI